MPGGAAWLGGATATVGAVLPAAASLWWQKAWAPLRRALLVPVRAVKAVHGGSLGDYALWFVTGPAVLGAGWGLTLR
ncbi:hypothetical protein ACH4ZX_03315 [Streptomyces sp. NPDC020490]|uniref:hypothetical protein n=1 Tax=Streptomyces sp. NPDC020490 TaxID=3365078 RepID=UPI0037BC1A7B